MHQRLALDFVFHNNRNDAEIEGGNSKGFLTVKNMMNWLAGSSADSGSTKCIETTVCCG